MVATTAIAANGTTTPIRMEQRWWRVSREFSQRTSRQARNFPHLDHISCACLHPSLPNIVWKGQVYQNHKDFLLPFPWYLFLHWVFPEHAFRLGFSAGAKFVHPNARWRCSIGMQGIWNFEQKETTYLSHTSQIGLKKEFRWTILVEKGLDLGNLVNIEFALTNLQQFCQAIKLEHVGSNFQRTFRDASLLHRSIPFFRLSSAWIQCNLRFTILVPVWRFSFSEIRHWLFPQFGTYFNCCMHVFFLVADQDSELCISEG